MRPVLGVVSIGQTPRPDLSRAFSDEAPQAEVRVRGALDGVGESELAALTAPGTYPLLVRLSSSRTIEVPMDRLVPLVALRARELANEGAAVVVVACAGGFPAVPCPVPLLLPGRIVPAVAGALTQSRRIGVITPNRAQVPFAEAKWREDGFEPRVTWASPDDEQELRRAADDLAGAGIDLVVLDCMGHDDECRGTLARLTGLPVIAAQSLVARVAAALI